MPETTDNARENSLDSQQQEASPHAEDEKQLESFSEEELAFRSSRERFQVLCNLIKGLVIRYIRLHSPRLLNDSGMVQAARISAHEVLHVSGIEYDASGEEWLNRRKFPTLSNTNAQLARFRSVIERRIEATYALNQMEVMIPETIQAQFKLSANELLLLCVVAAPQLDENITRLYQFATGLDTTIFPGWFYADLLADGDLEPIDILQMLDPDSPLRMYSLVEVGRQSDWGNLTPILQAPLSVPNRITSFLVGGEPDNSVEYAEIYQPEGQESELFFSEGFKKQVLRHFRRVKPRIALFGTRGFGRRSLIREYAASQNLKTIEIDFSLLTADESVTHLISLEGLWFREARLCNAIMVFRCDAIQTTEIENMLMQTSGHFKHMLDLHPGAVCIIAESNHGFIKKLFGDYTEILCRTPSRAEQYDLWTKALEVYLSGQQLEETVNYISSSYCLTMGEIKNAIQSCRARIGSDRLTGAELAETLRTTRGQALEGLADLKSTHLGLGDIVLSDEARSVIDEILNFARYSEFVSNDWGFSRVSSASGLSVLFSGPPGTGKTLTAGVLAHELKRALYVVDISRVVDKYIGETEKRLAKIFDHAQASQAILLFDEADSLFAKRTNVKSSNDRYANLEVNYLLQRLEAYHGVCILTTNLADSLDEALARRIQFKVAFPMPDRFERAKLWAFLLPQKAHKNNIDFQRLAEGFEMSGGHIKNAVFRACIQAASQNSLVTTEMLWDAAVHEYREMGHVIREYQDEDELY